MRSDRPGQAHFVTGCQQLLALGAVLAVLTPAASVLTLDVVRETPGHAPEGAGAGAVGLSAYTREAQRPARVPTAPTDARITRYAMTAPAGGGTVTSVSPDGVMIRTASSPATAATKAP